MLHNSFCYTLLRVALEPKIGGNISTEANKMTYYEVREREREKTFIIMYIYIFSFSTYKKYAWVVSKRTTKNLTQKSEIAKDALQKLAEILKK